MESAEPAAVGPDAVRGRARNADSEPVAAAGFRSCDCGPATIRAGLAETIFATAARNVGLAGCGALFRTSPCRTGSARGLRTAGAPAAGPGLRTGAQRRWRTGTGPYRSYSRDSRKRVAD